eukprot:12892319-Alexandrium_andersonii.AAC.1
MHVEAVRANDQGGAVQETPGAVLVAFRVLQLHAFAVRLEQSLATDDEGGSRFVHQDRRAACPDVIFKVGLVRALDVDV